jgi:hypothetical protein
MEKYIVKKIQDEEFHLYHKEGSVTTLICDCQDAEKADFLAKAANFYSQSEKLIDTIEESGKLPEQTFLVEFLKTKGLNPNVYIGSRTLEEAETRDT